uniref:Uncharacterized protein n=1 Tax=Rousettus aegyptiacus TaxID=9407 RepID=A0A7J8FIX4_ROUAE|nr:hypothetical protein HJG63_012073 [Rousettus aegyptiacus]
MSHSWPLPPSPCSLSPLLHSPSPKHRDHPRVGLETQGKDRETQPASVSACPTRVRGLRELAPATACPEAHTQNCAHLAKRTPALHFGLCASWAFPMSSSALASNSALPPPPPCPPPADQRPTQRPPLCRHAFRTLGRPHQSYVFSSKKPRGSLLPPPNFFQMQPVQSFLCFCCCVLFLPFSVFNLP